MGSGPGTGVGPWRPLLQNSDDMSPHLGTCLTLRGGRNENGDLRLSRNFTPAFPIPTPLARPRHALGGCPA